MKLLALLISFALFHIISKPPFLQSFAWLNGLKQRCLNSGLLNQPWLQTVVIFLPIILFTGLISYWLHQYHSHLVWYLLFNCLVLFYCLGPEQLEHHVALQTELDDGIEPAVKNQQLVIKRLTEEALQRWFAVFFWFVVFGAAGALTYRLFRQSLAAEDKEATVVRPQIIHIVYLLEYPVTFLMAFSLLIASDFDRIWHHCQNYFKQPQWYQHNRQFLVESMNFAVENCEIEADKPYSQQVLEQTTLSVLKRMLMVWLVLVALIVLLTIG